MTSSQKILKLREMILQTISPLVDGDYWILEVPYHPNVGDVLIWQGEIEFLRRFPYKCKGMISCMTFQYPHINTNDIIFMNGGGSFGDLWEDSYEFKLSILEHYHNNKIVFFPQTVYFTDRPKEERFLKKLAAASRAVVCVRDKFSYDYLKQRVPNNIILAPDMAFFIDIEQRPNKSSSPDLALIRNDRELKRSNIMEAILKRPNVIATDWPPAIPGNKITYLLMVLLEFRTQIPSVVDFFGRYFFRHYFIHSGMRAIANANHIYTMRMHGAILGLLLGKKVSLFDNSYHKCKQLYDTWLNDCDDIELIES